MLGEAEYIKWKICVHNSSPGMLIPFGQVSCRVQCIQTSDIIGKVANATCRRYI